MKRFLGFSVVLVAVSFVLTPRAFAQTAAPWSPPRTADGQPNIEGFWSEQSDITTYSIQAGAIDREEHTRLGGQATQFGRPIVDPPDGMIPYAPATLERAKYLNQEHRAPQKLENLDPVVRCFMQGMPRILYQSGMRIVQKPGYIVQLWEYGHHYRVIHLDGQPVPSESLKLWMGYSRGRWEGNTLVVEVTNNNAETWFDIVGSFHSDALRVTERYTFAQPDQIDYVATIEDPKVYARPWKLAMAIRRNKPQEQWESAVCEGNKAVHVSFDLPFEGEAAK